MSTNKQELRDPISSADQAGSAAYLYCCCCVAAVLVAALGIAMPAADTTERPLNQRMPQLPGVPTIADNGLAGYEHEQWYGLFAPARTPAPVVQAMYREISRIVNTPEIKERLVATGHRVIASTPQELPDKVRREIEKTRKIMLELTAH